MTGKWKLALAIGLAILIAGCASRREIVKERSSEHAHLYLNTKDAGDYHVRSFMSRKSGEIGVEILDRHEEPYYIYTARIKAEISTPQGDTSEIWLEGQGYKPEPTGLEDYSGQAGAYKYTKQMDLVKKAHNVKLKVWVLLPDKKIYELEFKCRAEEAMPEHSGIVTE